MLIKALKSGKYAHPEPCRGAVNLITGKIVNVDYQLGTSLILNKWASPVDLEKMTKADLVELGAPDDVSKQEMIDAIRLL